MDWPSRGEKLTDLFVDWKKCSNSVLTICLYFSSFFFFFFNNDKLYSVN